MPGSRPRNKTHLAAQCPEGGGLQAPVHGKAFGAQRGKLIFHLFASLAEFERSMVRERTRAGLMAARARGKMGGRPPALTEKDLAVAKKII